ncbi:LLM class flavin-dependent oxidoreductase [Streptomyces violaceusniger]|uniref:LLM class flavin-dependent oxidoreductase n=1 Tax=Streptomyces violaceusniger TaxID=68280 RepID=UPI0031D1EB93
MIIEDKLMVPESYGGSSERALRQGMVVPKHDPVPLAVAMGLATSHLGIVATLSTMAYPPFMTARLASTTDSMLGGRFGWDIVTSAEQPGSPEFRHGEATSEGRPLRDGRRVRRRRPAAVRLMGCGRRRTRP